MTRRLALLALLLLGLAHAALADDEARLDPAGTSPASRSLWQQQVDSEDTQVGASPIRRAVAKAALAPKDAPTVAVTFPQANATISTQLTPTIILKATASDPDETLWGVSFFICPATGSSCASPATIAGTAYSSPYQVAWTPPLPPIYSSSGTSTPYLVWAVAANTLGQERASSVVPFTVLQPPSQPGVTLVVPNAAIEGLVPEFVTPAAPVLYATAIPDNTTPPSSIVRMEFLDGSNVIGTVATPNTIPGGYAFVWSNPTPGAHMISARAVDSLGDWSTSAAVPIYIVGPDLPPQVTLTAPTSGQIFTSSSVVPLAATATSSQGSVQRVEFTAGTTVIASVFSPPFTGSWVNPPAGHFTITANTYDDLGLATASGAAYIEVLAAPRPPAVVLTAPSPGTTIATGVPLTLAATALAPDGSVGRVDFYAGGTMIGSAPTYPYSYTWSNPTAGAVLLIAKAYDLQGHSGTSTPVPVTVINSQPPVVSLTSPVGGASFPAPATVSLAATASAATGSIAKVEFLANGVVIGTRSAAPYSFTWSGAAAGIYALTARATDSLGSVGTSNAVGISVMNDAPPSVALTTPTNGQSFYIGQPIAFAATASDADGTVSKVEFLADGAVIAIVASTPYAFTWTGAMVGTHALTARATDNLGVATTSATATITVAANNPPSVSLTAPNNGQAFAAGQPITLAASASDSDGTVAKVEFLADGTVVGTVTASPYTKTWSGAAVGTHTLSARATDNRGAVTTSAAITITVTPGSVPTVALSMPRSNQIFAAGAIVNLAAIAADAGGAIVRVEFYAGSTLIGSVTTAPYNYAWTNVPAGSYVLTAKAIDDHSAVGTSSGVALQVISPALTITIPAANASIPADFVLVMGTYQAPPNSGVTVNGVVANNDGQTFFVNNFRLAPGANTLTVTLTTADGQTFTQTRTVTSTGMTPFQITADPDNAFAPATVVLRAANRGSNSITAAQVANFGTGVADGSMFDGETLVKLTFTAAGVYTPTVTVTDTAANTYTQTAAIMVQDKAALDQMLKAVWGDFMNSLATGNKDVAMRKLGGPAQAKYGPVFDVLGPHLGDILASWSAPTVASRDGGVAELGINRIVSGVQRLFLIYMIQGYDGIWRIDAL
jgi:hypothetical protein